MKVLQKPDANLLAAILERITHLGAMYSRCKPFP